MKINKTRPTTALTIYTDEECGLCFDELIYTDEECGLNSQLLSDDPLDLRFKSGFLFLYLQLKFLTLDTLLDLSSSSVKLRHFSDCSRFGNSSRTNSRQLICLGL